jgi:hypothetical protein
MIRLKKNSKKVERETLAGVNKADASKSTDASAPESGGEIPNQSKNKSHCFCPKLAEEHGEEAAVILQGLGYKIAKSKKVHDNRKWHYDTLAALEKRWPYLRDSGIGGILDRHASEGRVFKGRFNKWQKDRTNWYSMADALVARAMDEEGKLWFDVAVAVKCHSIIAGTLYQNLRYQLLLLLAENPEHEATPYHRVNKADLARVLPWSLSTIKRGYKELLKAGLIAENPACDQKFTICNATDLIVPDGMIKHANKSGSSAEMGIGSSAEITGSSTEQSGSSTEEIGSSTVNNTHYKPFQKHIHKDHSLNAARGVSGFGECAFDVKGNVHEDIRHDSLSAPVPGKENESVLDLDIIRARIMALSSQITDAELAQIREFIPGFSQHFIEEEISYSTFKECSQSSVPAQIIAMVEASLRTFSRENGAYYKWSNEGIEFSFLSCLEIVTGVLLRCDADKPSLEPKVKHVWEPITDIFENHLPNHFSRTEPDAEEKAEMFINEIRRCNKEGWPTYKSGDVRFTVNASEQSRTATEEFLTANPELSAEDVWRILSDCIEVQVLKPRPPSFDPLWKTRKGVQPTFLFKYWEDINAELDAARPLAA